MQLSDDCDESLRYAKELQGHATRNGGKVPLCDNGNSVGENVSLGTTWDLGMLFHAQAANCSYMKDLMPRGKGRRLAGRVEGEAGRCGERAVCEERGDRKWRVESKKPGRRGGVVECEFS